MAEVIRSSASTGTVLIRDDSGSYQVLQGDDCLASTSVLSLAEIEYQEAVVRAGGNARERLAKERAYFDAEAGRAEAARAKHANATKKGGGGRRF